jgi:hypothetical protein
MLALAITMVSGIVFATITVPYITDVIKRRFNHDEEAVRLVVEEAEANHAGARRSTM